MYELPTYRKVALNFGIFLNKKIELLQQLASLYADHNTVSRKLIAEESKAILSGEIIGKNETERKAQLQDLFTETRDQLNSIEQAIKQKEMELKITEVHIELQNKYLAILEATDEAQ